MEDDLDAKQNKENFGDLLTPYLIEKFTGRKPILFHPATIGSKFIKHSIMTGSIIMESTPKTIVWGSGIIRENERIKGGKFLAVRGYKTIKRLVELGFSAPKYVGDPALLLPILYKPNISKTYQYGVVAHYVDYEDVKKELGRNSDTLIIDLLTDNIENVIDNILSCEKIISTSLHGIIVANAYEIPALWLKFSNKLIGDDIKFYDYFESVGLSNVSSKEKSEFEIKNLQKKDFFIPTTDKLIEIQKGLLESFPYRIRRKQKIE